MAQVNKKITKQKNSTLAIDSETSNRLDFFCKKNNITKKEFIELSLNYFERTGVDIHSNDMIMDLNSINEKIDILMRFQADSALKLTAIHQTTNILNEVKEDTSKLIEQKETKKGFFGRFSKK